MEAIVGALALAGVVSVVLLGALVEGIARRIVGTRPTRKAIRVSNGGEVVWLPRTPETMLTGDYGLWFGDNFESHARIGRIRSITSDRVVRSVLSATTKLPEGEFDAHWTAHAFASPEAISENARTVAIPLEDGTEADAWLLSGGVLAEHWTIHVQGIRTSRHVTLRTVAITHRAGYTSLAITFRGAGDGPTARASTLGMDEWQDLLQAIKFARNAGAETITVIAWSMGASIALELARRDPRMMDRLVLVCPATNWGAIIHHAAQKARLPGWMARLAVRALEFPLWARVVGWRRPIEVKELDWSSSSLAIPTLVIHSAGDDLIPVRLSSEFASAQPSARLVETAPAPHGFEWNVDEKVFTSSLNDWLASEHSSIS